MTAVVVAKPAKVWAQQQRAPATTDKVRYAARLTDASAASSLRVSTPRHFDKSERIVCELDGVLLKNFASFLTHRNVKHKACVCRIVDRHLDANADDDDDGGGSGGGGDDDDDDGGDSRESRALAKRLCREADADSSWSASQPDGGAESPLDVLSEAATVVRDVSLSVATNVARTSTAATVPLERNGSRGSRSERVLGQLIDVVSLHESRISSASMRCKTRCAETGCDVASELSDAVNYARLESNIECTKSDVVALLDALKNSCRSRQVAAEARLGNLLVEQILRKRKADAK